MADLSRYKVPWPVEKQSEGQQTLNFPIYIGACKLAICSAEWENFYRLYILAVTNCHTYSFHLLEVFLETEYQIARLLYTFRRKMTCTLLGGIKLDHLWTVTYESPLHPREIRNTMIKVKSIPLDRYCRRYKQDKRVAVSVQ